MPTEGYIIDRRTRFVAIDQSYEECGISIFEGQTLIAIYRINFKLIEKKGTTKFRKKHKRFILKMAIAELLKHDIKCIVVERVRTFSAGFISTNVIAALSELIVTIIDAIPINVDIPIVSVDTRAWKSKAMGPQSSKKGMTAKEKKQGTLEWAAQFLTQEIQEKRKFRTLTDNEADSIGIGKAFALGVKVLLEE